VLIDLAKRALAVTVHQLALYRKVVMQFPYRPACFASLCCAPAQALPLYHAQPVSRSFPLACLLSFCPHLLCGSAWLACLALPLVPANFPPWQAAARPLDRPANPVCTALIPSVLLVSPQLLEELEQQAGDHAQLAAGLRHDPSGGSLLQGAQVGPTAAAAAPARACFSAYAEQFNTKGEMWDWGVPLEKAERLAGQRSQPPHHLLQLPSCVHPCSVRPMRRAALTSRSGCAACWHACYRPTPFLRSPRRKPR
jgi:hypothetical protein